METVKCICGAAIDGKCICHKPERGTSETQAVTSWWEQMRDLRANKSVNELIASERFDPEYIK